MKHGLLTWQPNLLRKFGSSEDYLHVHTVDLLGVHADLLLTKEEAVRAMTRAVENPEDLAAISKLAVHRSWWARLWARFS